LLPSSTWRSTPRTGRYPPKLWLPDTNFRRAISSRFCRRWFATASCAASAVRIGGYELAREHKDITAEDILRAASTTDEAEELPVPLSGLVSDIVRPALAEAERSFSAALSRINIEDMTKRARGKL